MLGPRSKVRSPKSEVAAWMRVFPNSTQVPVLPDVSAKKAHLLSLDGDMGLKVVGQRVREALEIQAVVAFWSHCDPTGLPGMAESGIWVFAQKTAISQNEYGNTL